MRYETPKLTVLTAAVDAVQSREGIAPKSQLPMADSLSEETVAAYQDWE